MRAWRQRQHEGQGPRAASRGAGAEGPGRFCCVAERLRLDPKYVAPLPGSCVALRILAREEAFQAATGIAEKRQEYVRVQAQGGDAYGLGGCPGLG